MTGAGKGLDEDGDEKPLDRPMEAVLDEATELADDSGKVTLGDLLDAWGDRSYGPLFIILGFVAGTPLAVVPPASAIVGVVVAILALQMAFGKTHPFAPGIFMRRSISKEKLEKVRAKSKRLLAFFDALVRERWRFASGALARRIAAVAVLALGILMVPLDAVPVLVAAPSWAVVLFGVAILARDGLVMMLATAAFIAVVVLAVSFL